MRKLFRKEKPGVEKDEAKTKKEHPFINKLKASFNTARLNLINKIKKTRIPIKILDFMKWEIIDMYRLVKHGRKDHIFGIWCFVGIYGGGKTISLVNYLEDMRRKYGDRIYISTNFFYKNQDFPLTHWKDILTIRDKPIIFGYDELQNEFNSRDYRNFPSELMYILTQNRKGHGKQIVYTTQDFETVDKSFRILTKTVVLCRTILNRLTKCRYYTLEQYDNLNSVKDIGRRMRLRPYMTTSFVQTDDLRDLYDSYAMLESAKHKEYIDRSERKSS